MQQQIFNPANFNFTWTDNWYEWDRDEAHKAARRARDEAAKAAKAQGKTVTKFTLSHQLITRGGIGSGKPQIEMVVTCYGLNAR